MNVISPPKLNRAQHKSTIFD